MVYRSPDLNRRPARWQRRVVATALVSVLLSLAAPSSAWADIGPYAKVLDSNGNVVAQFGAFYGAQPGSQIQLAENYAQCRQTTVSCSNPGTPAYPKVVLEPGTYHLLAPFGAVWPKCVGIFAYSAVKLEAASGAVLENDITSSDPCSGGPQGPGSLDAVIFSGKDPTNINAQGSSVNISGLQMNVGYGARFGLEVGAVSGPGSRISGLTITKPNSSGILVGAEDLPASGTSGSPLHVNNNAVQYSSGDGIILGGKWIKAVSNTVSDSGDHGIVVYQKAGGASNEISANTVTNAPYGVSLDASDSPAGTDNSVYNNTIGGTCVGVVLYRQIQANVAGNHIANPRSNAACAGTIFDRSVGVGIMSSYNNVAWSNQTWDYDRGIWIIDTGVSPGGLGTHWNYIGFVASWGQPFPEGWPVAGNWINGGSVGMAVESFVYPLNDQDNAFGGNVVSGAATPCYYDSPQWRSGNTPSHC